MLTHFAWIIHRDIWVQWMNWRCHIHNFDNFLHYLSMYILHRQEQYKISISAAFQLHLNLNFYWVSGISHPCKYLRWNCLQTTSFQNWWQCSILLFPHEWLPFYSIPIFIEYTRVEDFSTMGKNHYNSQEIFIKINALIFLEL